MESNKIDIIEKSLDQKERKYSELMRKSFEVSLKNRDKADVIHDKALDLFDEIMETRIELDMSYA